MLYHKWPAPESVCSGKLFWIWGVYAVVMLWLWNALLGAGGFPLVAIWALAGIAGAAVLFATREI